MAEVKLIRLSEIQSEPVDWLWEPYLARGAISLIQGDGGTGKTTMSLAIAAAITRGESISGSGSGYTAPANVIIQNAEDSYDQTIKPRLEQLGADCDRVITIDEENKALTFLDQRLEQSIIDTKAVLFIFDPVQAFFANANMNSANSVRPIMKHLGGIASRTGCSVLLVGHFHKRGGKAQYRGLGSVDIYAAARSVLTVGIADADENIRAVIQNKSNLASPGATLAFSIDPVGGFCWRGEYDITIDELLNGRRQQAKPENQFAKARMFIENILRNGPVPSADIWELAEDKGIAEKTLRRAKSALGAISRQIDNVWHWELPIDADYVVRDEGGHGQPKHGQGGQTEKATILTALTTMYDSMEAGHSVNTELLAQATKAAV